MLHGLSQINVEISSVCAKRTKCYFCGHQDPTIHTKLQFGKMDTRLMQRIAQELRPLGKHLVWQAHRDGDPVDADNLLQSLELFDAHIRSIVTHGCSLAEHAQKIIGRVEALTVSIFRGDPDREIQLASLRSFLEQKGDKLPRVLLKVVGDMSDEELADYTALPVPIIHRKIHVPFGNSKYANGVPTMPEHGVCLDLLHHPSIAWDGRVFLCNRLDVKDAGLIGNLNEDSLDAIWNGKLRADYIQQHLEGRRAEVPPCKECRYYGIPTA
jgi:radical SAM protein with 4Fe4S-binding SPASM domain